MSHFSIYPKIFCFFSLLFLFCGCEEANTLLRNYPHKYSFSYFAPLDDRNYVRTDITLAFDQQNGVLEATRKYDRVRYAIDLIVRPYNAKQMADNGKRIRKIIKRVTEEMLETPVKDIVLSKYTVVYNDGKEEGQGEGEAGSENIETQFLRTHHQK